jgi:hypothetical protein
MAEKTNPHPGATTDVPGPSDATRQRAREASDDIFLVPGPTPESNEGTARWAITWIVFSLVLMLLILAMSFVCWVLARVTGIA